MKFDFKKKMKNVDDDLISELISKAEEAMVHPLKKSKVEVVDVGDNTDAESEDEESQDHESPEVESEEEDSLDPEDLKKLLEIYNTMKD